MPLLLLYWHIPPAFAPLPSADLIQPFLKHDFDGDANGRSSFDKSAGKYFTGIVGHNAIEFHLSFAFIVTAHVSIHTQNFHCEPFYIDTTRHALIGHDFQTGLEQTAKPAFDNALDNLMFAANVFHTGNKIVIAEKPGVDYAAHLTG